MDRTPRICIVLGTRPEIIKMLYILQLLVRGGWKNPFGDGNASKRIINVISGC